MCLCRSVATVIHIRSGLSQHGCSLVLIMTPLAQIRGRSLSADGPCCCPISVQYENDIIAQVCLSGQSHTDVSVIKISPCQGCGFDSRLGSNGSPAANQLPPPVLRHSCDWPLTILWWLKCSKPRPSSEKAQEMVTVLPHPLPQ